MVLHTDQQHPHVHLVVKAEGNHGHRLHIDKPMLRAWREDFARMMREQGIAANATSRVLRGRNSDKAKSGSFRAKLYGASTALRERFKDIAKELAQTGTIRDPARARLIATRKAIIAAWMKTADGLDAQGEVALAGDLALKLSEPRSKCPAGECRFKGKVAPFACELPNSLEHCATSGNRNGLGGKRG